MLGELTIQVGKVLEEYIDRLAHQMSDMSSKIPADGNYIEVGFYRVPMLLAAYGLYKGENPHPKPIWGKFWFLYYQAWFWKFSRGWRESTMESWLKELVRQNKLDALLANYL